MGAVRQLFLPRDGTKGRIADHHLYAGAVQAMLAKADGHRIRQDGNMAKDVPPQQVKSWLNVVPLPTDLTGARSPCKGHRGVFQSVGIFVKLLSHLAEQLLKHCGAGLRQLANSVNPVLVQRFGSSFPTNSSDDTGSGNTVSRQQSGERTVVASGFCNRCPVWQRSC